MLLNQFDKDSFDRGRPWIVEALWLVLNSLFVRSRIPGAAHRRFLLRVFGARLGTGVIIKPGVRIKFPWRLEIGDNSWIGEDAWIDNLATVEIGCNCCISQGVYICTGNHDWKTVSFDLSVHPVRIRDGAWIAARSTVGPGVIVGRGAVLALGSVATSDLEENGVYQGSPAKVSRRRPAQKGEQQQSETE